MALRHVWRCLRYLSLVVIAGMFIAGCVIQEPRAITEIGRARKACSMFSGCTGSGR